MILIKTTSDFDFLKSKPNKAFSEKIVIDPQSFQRFTKEEKSQWQNKLNGFKRECGGSLGTKCMFASLIAFTIIISLFQQWISMSIITIIFWAILTPFIAALFGKLIGLGLAKKRFKQFVNELQNTINN